MNLRTSERIRLAGNLRLVSAAAMVIVILFTTATAWACPRGYAPCGEKGQLCCPQR
jgi:hypothetical protein